MLRTQAMRLKFRPVDGVKLIVRGRSACMTARRISDLCGAHRTVRTRRSTNWHSSSSRKRLEAEGLFDEARKKPLPMLPRRIGVVTSPKGAAVRDILRILRRRFPNLHLIVYRCECRAMARRRISSPALNTSTATTGGRDLLLARGGGSIEDLWASRGNRRTRDCGVHDSRCERVGHEADFTIADFCGGCARVHAVGGPEIVVRSRQEIQRHLQELEHKISQQMLTCASRSGIT